MTNEHVEKYRGNGVANPGQFGKKFSNANLEQSEKRLDQLSYDGEVRLDKMVEDMVEDFASQVANNPPPDEADYYKTFEGFAWDWEYEHFRDQGYIFGDRENFVDIGVAMGVSADDYWKDDDEAYDVGLRKVVDSLNDYDDVIIDASIVAKLQEVLKRTG